MPTLQEALRNANLVTNDDYELLQKDKKNFKFEVICDPNTDDLIEEQVDDE